MTPKPSAGETREIFIAYRREDSKGFAWGLDGELKRRFGDVAFRDVRTIAEGIDWEAAIRTALTNVKVVLALIGPQWLDCKDAKGNRRLDDHNDHLRRELRIAIDLAKPVVVVRVAEAILPTAEQLPEDIRGILTNQSVNMPGRDVAQEVSAVVEAIRRNGVPLPEATSPAPPRVRSGTRLASLVGCAALALVAGYLIRGDGASNSDPSGPTVASVADLRKDAALRRQERLFLETDLRDDADLRQSLKLYTDSERAAAMEKGRRDRESELTASLGTEEGQSRFKVWSEDRLLEALRQPGPLHDRVAAAIGREKEPNKGVSDEQLAEYLSSPLHAAWRRDHGVFRLEEAASRLVASASDAYQRGLWPDSEVARLVGLTAELARREPLKLMALSSATASPEARFSAIRKAIADVESPDLVIPRNTWLRCELMSGQEWQFVADVRLSNGQGDRIPVRAPEGLAGARGQLLRELVRPGRYALDVEVHPQLVPMGSQSASTGFDGFCTLELDDRQTLARFMLQPSTMRPEAANGQRFTAQLATLLVSDAGMTVRGAVQGSASATSGPAVYVYWRPSSMTTGTSSRGEKEIFRPFGPIGRDSKFRIERLFGSGVELVAIDGRLREDELGGPLGAQLAQNAVRCSWENVDDVQLPVISQPR